MVGKCINDNALCHCELRCGSVTSVTSMSDSSRCRKFLEEDAQKYKHGLLCAGMVVQEVGLGMG